MVMLDESNQQWDQLVSSYILRERETQHKVKSDDSDGFVWTLEILQAYFSYIKATISPRLTPEAKTILKEYYLKQRRSDMADAGMHFFFFFFLWFHYLLVFFSSNYCQIA